MKYMKMGFAAGFLAMLLFTQAGCLLVAAAAGTGATVAYVRGDLESSVDAPPDRATAAAKGALEELNLRVISSSSSSLDGDVVARTASDDKIHIVIKSQGEKTSSISIRLGVFGDSAMQGRILGKIQEKLKEAPAVASAKPTTQPVASGKD